MPQIHAVEDDDGFSSGSSTSMSLLRFQRPGFGRRQHVLLRVLKLPCLFSVDNGPKRVNGSTALSALKRDRRNAGRIWSTGAKTLLGMRGLELNAVIPTPEILGV